jgi:GAF domain-containing protein
MPPVFEGDQEKTNSARVLHPLLIIITIATLLFPIISLVAGASIEPIVGVLVLILVTTALGLAVVMRLGYVQQAGIILGLVWWSLFSFGLFNFGGLHDTAITGFFFLIILGSIIGGWQVLLFFSGLAVTTFIGIFIAEQNGIIQPTLEIPSDAADLAMPIALIIASTMVLRIAIGFLTNAYDETRSNAAQLENINKDLKQSRNDLSARTQELERRTRFLEATTVIARDITKELNPNTLSRRVVTLITEQFGFYHTGLFIIDASREYAMLEAASSRGGQRMLERNHRLRVGEEGLVGYVAASGVSRVAFDTGADAVYFNNPDLPKTHSEIALPLLIQRECIGVLDVQSTELNAFDEEDMSALQTLADQIAVAIRTAQLFQQVEESLDAQRRAYGEISQDTWKKISQEQKIKGYQFVRGNVVPINEETSVAEKPDLPEIAVPIEIGGQTIGQITAHKPEDNTSWSSEEVAIMETLSNQLSVALESARLYQDSQVRAVQEQLTSEVTSRIRETLDIETIIKTASEEIRKALDLPEVVIRLGEPVTKPNGGPNRGVTE